VPDGQPADPPSIVIPYVEKMQYAYAAADFAVCRSGAMTCAELAAAGLPAAYVPLMDNASLDPAWIETTLIPLFTDVMAARRAAAL
jgi:UDP-N-acetylglucosamine--N-acetylmuramyl-(pentapeptide) pyrophosphoryl-undecaprenol N-acetylglucosamine transferase